MAEINNFEERVNSEKKKRLHNELNFKVRISEDDIEQFFKDKKINLPNVREFTRDIVGGKNKNVESSFSLLELNTGKEKIFTEIREKGPFREPKDLAIAIAEYIRAHMKYDTFSLLNQFRDAFIIGQANKEKIDSKLVSIMFAQLGMSVSNIEKEVVLKSFLNEGGEEKFFSIIVEKVKNNNAFLIDEGMMKIFSKTFHRIPDDIRKKLFIFQELDDLAQSHNLEGFREKFFTEYVKNEDFRLLLSSLEREMNHYEKETEIFDMLKNIHNGVCRHFSVILKEIYNAMAPSMNFGTKTEMLYVGNGEHAYNLLISEGKDGNFQKQYFDVTNLVSGQEWQKKRDDMPDETEFWVNNSYGMNIKNV